MTTQYIYDLTDTWNAGGTVFNAIKMNVTDSASAAGSKLLELQKDSVSFFNVGKNGNVGIGLASPSYLFHVQNASADASAFIGQTASRGLFWQWRYNATAGSAFGEISTFGGDNALRIQAQAGGGNTVLNLQSGSVGIGTASPAQKLDVSGRVRAFTAASTLSELQFQALYTGNAVPVVLGQGADGTGYLTNLDNDPLVFGTNATERMRITAAGAVGIGTSSPTSTLSVGPAYGGTPNSQSQLTVQNIVNTYLTIGAPNNGDTGLLFADPDDNDVGAIGYNHNTNAMTFYSNAGERMRITSSGEVGIGTTNPAGKLDVAGNNTSIYLRSNDTNDATLRYFVNSVEVATARGKNGNIFAIETGGTERMRIDSSGNVGIGTTSPANRLHVNSGASTTIAALESTGASAFFNLKNSGASVFIGNDNASGSFVIQTPSGSFSTKFTLDNAGNVGIGVTPNAWTTYRALQVTSAALFSATGNESVFSSNMYYDGSYRYRTSDSSTMYVQFARQHQWYSAASGTAGNVIAYTQAMTLSANGNLLVGTTSDDVGIRAKFRLDRNEQVSFGVENNNIATGSSVADRRVLIGVAGPSAPVTGWINRAYIDAAPLDGFFISTASASPVILATNRTERFRVHGDGNIGIGNTDQFGSGVKVVGIANATTVPTTNPTGGGVLYVEGGALKYRGSSGTITTIANA